jgi:hypothetical protein
MTSRAIDPDLLQSLRDGFGGRPTVAFKEASRLMRMDEKTLRKHVREGRIQFRDVGLGQYRVRREFTLEDIVGFYCDACRRNEVTETVVRTRAPLPRTLLGFTEFAERPPTKTELNALVSNKRAEAPRKLHKQEGI